MIIAADPTLHIAGVVRSPQLQYELGEATAGLREIRLDLRVGELRSAGRQLLASQASPDALLLDLDVDDAQDMAVLARLAEQAGRASIPIVATAGDLGPSTMRRLLRDGVTDFIGQPIDRTEVVEMVRVVSRKARRAQATKAARVGS
jgi:FixJ family two-component response regulator